MSAGFCWYEHLSEDPARARRFYAGLFGWQVEELGGYWIWKHEGAEVGGTRELPRPSRLGGAPAHWLGHVAVGDHVNAVEQAAARGGNVVGPQTRVVEGLGAFTLVRDPQGALVALSSTGRRCHRRSSHGGTRGGVGWRELAATDADAAWAYYEPLLAWRPVTAWELGAELGTYLVGARAGDVVGGMANSARLAGVHPHWAYYFDVEDAAAASARATAHGGRVVHGPFETPRGDYVAYCEDDQGAVFGLREPRRPDPTAA